MERLEVRALLASPLVITKGGTYRGTWESLDPNRPAVVINTAEKVIIEDSTIRSRGHLIASGVDHVNITVRRTSGYGLNPNRAGRMPGRFINLEDFDNVIVDDSFFENTSGIHLLRYMGDRTPAETIRITDNYAHNIDGRKSNGNGGWRDYNVRINLTTNVVDVGFDYAQFIQFDKVNNVPGIEIAWNQVINDPASSRVEDNINIYKSSGTAASPISIHDNYIRGAYTIRPWQSSYTKDGFRYDWTYSGGGILLGDGRGNAASEDSAFVKVYDNQVVSTTNYGIAIAAGHDLEARNNRVLSAGVLSDGRAIKQQNVGLYVQDAYDLGSGRFVRNSIHHNTSGWVQGSGRNDWWTQFPGALVNNTHWGGSLTTATETAELNAWKKKYAGPHTGTMGGTIFLDLDADGKKDSNESGWRGVRVYVDLDGDGKHDSTEPSSLSSSSGRWEIKMSAGEFRVRLITPANARATRGTSEVFDLSAAEVLTRHFGLAAPSTITGLVFMDADKDGTKDPAEAPLPAWRVYIDADGDGALDASEISVLTDAAGKFSFSGVAPGTYRVRVIGSTNYRMTAPTSGYLSVTVAAGQTVSAGNFGLKRLK